MEIAATITQTLEFNLDIDLDELREIAVEKGFTDFPVDGADDLESAVVNWLDDNVTIMSHLIEGGTYTSLDSEELSATQ